MKVWRPNGTEVRRAAFFSRDMDFLPKGEVKPGTKSAQEENQEA